VRYFHRTHLPPDAVLLEADAFFGRESPAVEVGPRRRIFTGPLGRVRLSATAEGGHYTRVEIETDQMGESELDKLSKRFLALVHRRVEPGYALRGAY
jgi:hypothetical protein